MTWSPFSEASMTDHASGYDELLAQCPVHRTDSFDPPFYTLSRFEDVLAALRDIETFSSEYGQGPRFSDPIGMLCDPPQHTFYRNLVQPSFTPKAINALTSEVEQLTDQLIGEVKQRGDRTFDAHDDLAFPLPVTIIARLLRVPTDDLARFKHWSDVQVAAMGAQDPAPYAQDQADFLAYMQNHLRTERARIDGLATADTQDIHPGAPQEGDLLSRLAGARDNNDWLPEPQVLSVLNQLLVGGNETTTSLITNALWRLLSHREHWERLCQESDYASAVVEESLRFDPPVLGLYRNTTRRVTLHGTQIPANAKVLLNYAAANRDPEVFSQPNEFNPARQQPKHLAFGLGVHFCVGAPMARLEATVALQALALQLPSLKLAGPNTRIGPFFLWGRHKLPVTF